MNLTDYVTITKNNTDRDPQEIVSIVKRYNNPKRDFLFINKYLGKHYPVRGNDAFDHFQQLYRQLVLDFSQFNRVMIISFAETATALGEYIAQEISTNNSLNLSYYIQTTREITDKDIRYIDFSEEHSHATGQRLYLDTRKIKADDFDSIIFVEDEITTGKTILNAIARIREIYPEKNINYGVASILNWQNKQNSDNFSRQNIKTSALLYGELKDDAPVLTVETQEIEVLAAIENTYRANMTPCYNPRFGLFAHELQEHNSNLYKYLSNIQLLLEKDPINLESCLVLGTEEAMFSAILLASKLGCKTQSTTRSPIAPSLETTIIDGIQFPSAYETSRKTYLYNLGGTVYDKIIILLEDPYSNKYFEDALYKRLKQHSATEILFSNYKKLERYFA